MEKLIGKKINSIEVYGDYHDNIVFKTDSGEFNYNAYGDCCSSSFFSDIWYAKNILGEVINSVQDIELTPGEAPIRKGTTDDDNEQIYGIRITSEKGSCTIIFRNHSNGYYGGSIQESDAPAEVNKSWTIEDNWSAPSL